MCIKCHHDKLTIMLFIYYNSSFTARRVSDKVVKLTRRIPAGKQLVEIVRHFLNVFLAATIARRYSR